MSASGHLPIFPGLAAMAALPPITTENADIARAKEAAKTFDAEFIELTRSVYLNNDKRAGIKRRINELSGSGLVEEKQYTAY